MKPPVFCTSICANYLGKALALSTSLKRWMPESIFIIALVEREIPAELEVSRYPAVDHIILAKDFIKCDSFDSWIFRHSIVEAATAIKGELLRHLYRRFGEAQHFIYIDPDTFVYSPFDELFIELTNAPIVLTPHLDVPGNLEMELSSLKHGVFNLGFLAIARHPESEKFLDWWADRLDFACYDDIPNGIFTDQKWINLIPGFFPVAVLRHPGYNFATWSLMDRKLSLGNDGLYLVNGERLRFTHFSGFDGGTFHKCIEKWAPGNRDLLTRLAEDYSAECRNHQSDVFRKIRWSYGSFRSGKPISRWARIFWRERRHHDKRNPFDLGNFTLTRSILRPSRWVPALRKLLRS